MIWTLIWATTMASAETKLAEEVAQIEKAELNEMEKNAGAQTDQEETVKVVEKLHSKVNAETLEKINNLAQASESETVAKLHDMTNQTDEKMKELVT